MSLTSRKFTMPIRATKQNVVSPGQKIDVEKIQNFTRDQSVNQGFRFVVNQGSNPQPLVLTIPGIMILGISVLTLPLTNIADTYVTLKVNGYSVVESTHALQLCPNYALGQIIFPTPYMLAGNDKISVDFNKVDAGSIVLGFTIQYLPDPTK